jgi:glycosyltransferase involved in cell wall biosynthesis
MNILLISPAIYPCAIGGVEVFNYNFSKELADRGNNVYILTTCKYDWTNKNISLVKLGKKILLHATLSICFHIFLKIIEFRKEIDVIHVPYTSNSPLAYPMVLAKKLFGIPPYVIVIHGGGMYPWKPKIIHKLFFQYADAVIAISEIIRTEYEKRCCRRIEVIPPLIPFRESKNSKEKLRVKYGFDGKDTILLFLGTIKKIKGCDILLDAFFSLGEEYLEKNNLKLLYVGDGPMKPILTKRVYEKGFNKYVKFFGSIQYESIPDMYKIADIYVVPSLFEGTPIALLEALFNGLPIIGTDTNGINNIICNERSGLLFKKEDIGDLKEKIRNLVEDKELRIQLGNSGKKDYFKTYNFNDAVSKHIKLYRNIIEDVPVA